MSDYNAMCTKFDNAADRFSDAVDRKTKEIALVLTNDTKKTETDDERCRRIFEEAQFSTEQSDRLLNEPKSWDQVQFDSCFIEEDLKDFETKQSIFNELTAEFSCDIGKAEAKKEK